MKERQLTVKFREEESTLQAQVIDVLGQYPSGAKLVVQETINARFVPLVLEVCEANRALALNYIEQCEAYARAARKRWGMEPIAGGSGISGALPPYVSSAGVSGKPNTESDGDRALESAASLQESEDELQDGFGNFFSE